MKKRFSKSTNEFLRTVFLFLFEFSYYFSAALNRAEVFKENISVFGIERDQTVSAEFFEISVTVKYEYLSLIHI